MEGLVANYGSPFQEALICRQDAALFDFSFVCRVRITGGGVVSALESFQPRMISDMRSGQIHFSVRTNSDQKVVSDITIWRLSLDCYEVMSARPEDIPDLLALQSNNLVVGDMSLNTAILAILGPASVPIAWQ
jgi:aminomethyltransferase